jgi:hypothetical protein
MRMTTPITPLFDYAIDELVAALPGEADPAWDLYRLRQQRFEVHDATRSILFRWTAPHPSGSPAILTSTYPPAPLADAVMACGSRLARALSGTATALLLTELRPGQRIGRHCDSGELLERTRRCHLPIVTNPDVRFLIDDEPYQLRAGTVYELDNMRPHSVENGGSTRRVHLICNILPDD